MARKLDLANFTFQQELICADAVLRGGGETLCWPAPWWQAAPHFFDHREIEVLLEPDLPKSAAPRER